MGQTVFEKLKAAASKHFSNDTRFRLDAGFLGFIPYDRDTFRNTEEMRHPYLSAFPDRSASECTRSLAAELLKSASLAELALSRVKSGSAPAARPQACTSETRAQENGFRRFVEILKMNI